MSSATASANLSAVAWVRDLRSHGSLTALTSISIGSNVGGLLNATDSASIAMRSRGKRWQIALRTRRKAVSTASLGESRPVLIEEPLRRCLEGFRRRMIDHRFFQRQTAGRSRHKGLLPSGWLEARKNSHFICLMSPTTSVRMARKVSAKAEGALPSRQGLTEKSVVLPSMRRISKHRVSNIALRVLNSLTPTPDFRRSFRLPLKQPVDIGRI